MINYDLLKNEFSGKGFDIDRLTDSKGKPIEEKIKPLVLVLNHLGYKTNSSCEGHALDYHKSRLIGVNGKIIEEDEYHFIFRKKFGQIHANLIFDQAPFVDMALDPNRFNQLDSLVRRYNSQNSIPWYLKERERCNFRFSPNFQHSLTTLQGSILLIAEFLYKNR